MNTGKTAHGDQFHKVLEHVKRTNDWRLLRNQSKVGTNAYKYAQQQVELLEAKIIRDKDGNSIGII